MNILYDRSNEQKLELENMVKMKFIYNVVIRNWKQGGELFDTLEHKIAKLLLE